jgi:hypothetical protein
VTIALQALSLVGKGKVGPSLLHTTLEGTNRVCECKMDVKSTWTLKSSNGSCSMVTWTIFKNHLLEVDLTHNREAMALPTFITVELLCFIMCEDLYEVTFIEIAFDFGLGHI